jgi:hypothetical protein
MYKKINVEVEVPEGKYCMSTIHPYGTCDYYCSKDGTSYCNLFRSYLGATTHSVFKCEQCRRLKRIYFPGAP